MKTTLLLLFFTCAVSCAIAVLTGCGGAYTPVKPWVITSKGSIKDNNLCYYDYHTANGMHGGFYEKQNKYSIGDTIK